MFEALIASVCVTLLSLVGVFIFKDKGKITGTHRFILPFAIGVFLSVVLIELIPETLADNSELGPFAVMFGFLGFFALSHVLRTFHHHHNDPKSLNASIGLIKRLIIDSHSIVKYINKMTVLVNFNYCK